VSPLLITVNESPIDHSHKRLLSSTLNPWNYPLPPALPQFAVPPRDFNSPAGAPVPADPSDALDTPAPDTNP